MLERRGTGPTLLGFLVGVGAGVGVGVGIGIEVEIGIGRGPGVDLTLHGAEAAAARGGKGGAKLVDRRGNHVGEITITQGPDGVLVAVRAAGLPPGKHGFHIHQTGKCDAPDFKSAGGHFNPGGHKHGFLSSGKRHAGDLPNLVAGADGSVTAEHFVPGVAISGGKAALLDRDGASVVIHAGPDDYRTDPAGDAGERIACGVIEPAD